MIGIYQYFRKKSGIIKKNMISVVCIGSIISLGGCTMLFQSNNMNEYSDALFQTIKEQDYKKFEELLSETGDVNQPRSNKKVSRSVDFENIYPLQEACFTSAQMAYDLLEHGARADVVDPYIESSPLIYALSASYPERFEVAERLIEAGSNLEHVDANQNTALNLCVVVFENESEETYRHSMEVLSYLLEHCNLELVMEKSNNNPLRAAAMCNNCRAIEYILTQGYLDVDTSWHGFTPLMNAAILQKKDACKLLLEKGADKAAVSPEGKTAYDYAAEMNNTELMNLLQ